MQDDDQPSQGTILVVEDEAGVRQFLDVVLRSFHFKVIFATDGHEALEIYPRNKIDLVLTDVQMPVLDGLKLFARLKAINPNIVCCFMSGDTGKYTIQELLQTGAAGFIKKPFDLNELRTMIVNAIEQQ
jgi:CheY-like chemotaxis protein